MYYGFLFVQHDRFRGQKMDQATSEQTKTDKRDCEPGASEYYAPLALKAPALRLIDDAAPRNGNIFRPLKSARYCSKQRI